MFDHFDCLFDIFSVHKLLVIEFAIPENTDFTTAVSKETDQSNHAGFRNEAERKFKRTNNAKKHPCYSPNDEGNGCDYDIEFGLAGCIKPTEVAQQHSGVNDSSDGQPCTFLVVDCVYGGNLELERVVVVVQEEIVVGISCLVVHHKGKDKFYGDDEKEADAGKFERGEFQDFDEAYDHADTDNIIDDHILFAEPPADSNSNSNSKTNNFQ